MHRLTKEEKFMLSPKNGEHLIPLRNYLNLAHISKDFTQLSIQLRPLYFFKPIIEEKGPKIAEFDGKFYNKLEARELIEFINHMPNLKRLSLDLIDGINGHDNVFDRFNLPHLKFLHIAGYQELFEVLEFLVKFLPQNVLTELYVKSKSFHSVSIQKLLDTQKEIRKLKVGNLTDDIGKFLDVNSTCFENLEELIVPDLVLALPDILYCFPNLKVLDTRTSLNLNTFAKFLPLLETLSLRYNDEKTFELYELDSGIVNENLMTLKIRRNVGGFWTFIGNSSEMYLMFPNLKSFDLEIERQYFGQVPKDISQVLNFFEDLSEWKNLRNLRISSISIGSCEEIFGEISSKLKELPIKLDKFFIKFEDVKRANFSYQKLIEKNLRFFSIREDEKGWATRRKYCSKIIAIFEF